MRPSWSDPQPLEVLLRTTMFIDVFRRGRAASHRTVISGNGLRHPIEHLLDGPKLIGTAARRRKRRTIRRPFPRSPQFRHKWLNRGHIPS